MNTVERIKQTCKEKKIPIYKLERDLGYSNGYIGGLKKGSVPDDRLRAIADYLGTTTDYLIYGKKIEYSRDAVMRMAGISLSKIASNSIKMELVGMLKDFPDEEMQNLIDYAMFRKQMHDQVEKEEKKKGK